MGMATRHGCYYPALPESASDKLAHGFRVTYNPMFRFGSRAARFRQLQSHRDLADSNEPRAAILVDCSDTDAIRLTA